MIGNSARPGSPRRFGALAIGATLVVLPLLAPTSARAQASDISEALFRDGKRLMDAGDFTAACPKLAESYRLDPGAGTLLNLGLCHKGEGKYASAATELREALSLARKAQRADRAQIATQALSEVEALRSHVVLDVQNATDDEEVKLDGVVIGAPAWQTPLPIDGGEHRLTASTKGHVFWEKTVSVGRSKDSVTVRIPEPPANAPKTEPAVASSTSPSRREDPSGRDESGGRHTATAGLIVGGIGLVAIGVGSYFGIRAASANSDSNKTCPDTRCADATALEQNSNARTWAWVADIGIGVGLVGVAVGTYLVLTDDSKPAPSKTTASSRFTPSVGKDSLGMSFRTVW